MDTSLKTFSLEFPLSLLCPTLRLLWLETTGGHPTPPETGGAQRQVFGKQMLEIWEGLQSLFKGSTNG